MLCLTLMITAELSRELIQRCSPLAGMVKVSSASTVRLCPQVTCCLAASSTWYLLRPHWLRSSYFDQGVVFALARMFLVARDQQDRVYVAIGSHRLPAISPRSLMSSPSLTVRPELGWIKLFKSTMEPPFSQRKDADIPHS